MSIELPEAQILADQLKTVIIGKKVVNYQLKDYDKMQKIGFINKNLSDFEKLINKIISNITARGNVIRIQMTDQVNLILGPEYGGILQFYEGNKKYSPKFHLLITFTDQSSLIVRLISMGGIFVSLDSDLGSIYLYRRDFSEKLSPIDPSFSMALRLIELSLFPSCLVSSVRSCIPSSFLNYITNPTTLRFLQYINSNRSYYGTHKGILKQN